MLDFIKKALKLKPESEQRPGLFQRLKAGLARTQAGFSEALRRLFQGKVTLDEELSRSLETVLLQADLGTHMTTWVLQELKTRMQTQRIQETEAIYGLLTQILFEAISPQGQPLIIPDTPKPFVILVVGINGAGKTTTIGKLAQHFQAQGKKVLLAAGDTFRAAAVEQLQAWGQTLQIPVISQHAKADSASVIFDALQAAQARHLDVLLADTAGRLHNQAHLMEELKKIIRVMRKLDPEAPHEVLLVLDASIGQNAIQQAKQFHAALQVSGLVLTKLDGTAKGGVLFAIADQFKLPIRFIGVGEKAEDLQVFDPQTFIEALLL